MEARIRAEMAVMQPELERIKRELLHELPNGLVVCWQCIEVTHDRAVRAEVCRLAFILFLCHAMIYKSLICNRHGYLAERLVWESSTSKKIVQGGVASNAFDCILHTMHAHLPNFNAMRCGSLALGNRTWHRNAAKLR